MAKKAKPGQAVLLGLLRGINVGGNKLVSMEKLRALATKAGLGSVSTFINSGNILFTCEQSPLEAEVVLEKVIEKGFGFTVDVVVRTLPQWEKYAAKSAFPDAEKARPKTLLLGLAKKPVSPGAAEALNAAAKDGERVVALPDALWIDYAASLGRSKLSPALLDRHAGSTVTGRNWNTVQTLAELLRALAGSMKT